MVLNGYEADPPRFMPRRLQRNGARSPKPAHPATTVYALVNEWFGASGAGAANRAALFSGYGTDHAVGRWWFYG